MIHEESVSATQAPVPTLQTQSGSSALQRLFPLRGRGLFFRERVASLDQWKRHCQSAREWGMTYVHPRVAKSAQLSYELADLLLMADVARQEGLQVFPEMTVYGGTALAAEIQTATVLGKVFSGLCLSFGEHWTHRLSAQEFDLPTQMSHFGEQVRARCLGPLYALSYACPSLYPVFPYEQMFAWCDGWMPRLFTSEMARPLAGETLAPLPKTAKDLFALLQREWQPLFARCQQQNALCPPMLPVLGIVGSLAPEALALVQKEILAQEAGYCGWWDAIEYAAHLQLFALNFPSSALLAPPQQQTSPQSVSPLPPKPVPEEKTESVPSTMPVEPTEVLPVTDATLSARGGMLRQTLSPIHLQLCWGMVDTRIPFDPTDPLVALWSRLTQAGYAIGAPTGQRRMVMGPSNKGCWVQECEGGRLFCDPDDQGSHRVWFQLAPPQLSRSWNPGAPIPTLLPTLLDRNGPGPLG